ncbi:2-keto-4-pentenoate hydratase [Actinoallomurus iriomotensis]|uniref:2-hydroxypenta-2,4-dienoate hydratase n=1 Tax=Actinoallomurus iriomotensis TaxID=478107 RepID=A0A9W6RBQ5_9ACTN|nr:fumarylacetoacetate hydrolase family protein [Actinoallomurus iriomotensis]GLY72873.1 2-hydroxypenta-2,4-dienoate hydratase [Actinoallomurus iriomotensis]GLY84369.1 2-hydroxypenta-2,4-dienoate hydratase [Actinoallomurus iriomotensis]
MAGAPADDVKTVDVEAIAGILDRAWEERHTIRPLSETTGLDSPATAYAIQTRWSELRAERGERVLGHKIGLTSQAMRAQIGVDEPDYGRLWESRFYPAEGGRSSVPAEVFLQPRVEGELAFLIGKPLDREDCTAEEVLAATDAIAASVEVIDSRITDWQIKLVDTIADDASYGAFTVGPWNQALRDADLRTIGMLVHRNGTTEVEALGSAVLGHPAESVAWLARTLNRLGTSLLPGDIVLSGSLGRALPASRGDEFVIETHGLAPLTVRFE